MLVYELMSCSIQISTQKAKVLDPFQALLDVQYSAFFFFFHPQHKRFWEHFTCMYNVKALSFIILFRLHQNRTHVVFWAGLIITRNRHSKISIKPAVALRWKKKKKLNTQAASLQSLDEIFWQLTLFDSSLFFSDLTQNLLITELTGPLPHR